MKGPWENLISSLQIAAIWLDCAEGVAAQLVHFGRRCLEGRPLGLRLARKHPHSQIPRVTCFHERWKHDDQLARAISLVFFPECRQPDNLTSSCWRCDGLG